MIGKLKKYSVREVYDKNVARVAVDIPMNQLSGREVDEEDIEDFLQKNVGTEIGFDISALDDTDQESLEQEGEEEGEVVEELEVDEVDF